MTKAEHPNALGALICKLFSENKNQKIGKKQN